jgi:hypothetical protein
MGGTRRLSEALMRIRAVFRGTTGVELVDTEVAMLTGLDDEECRILLGVLEETGAIVRPRSRVFVCRPSSWWASAPVRPQPVPASPSRSSLPDRAPAAM